MLHLDYENDNEIGETNTVTDEENDDNDEEYDESNKNDKTY